MKYSSKRWEASVSLLADNPMMFSCSCIHATLWLHSVICHFLCPHECCFLCLFSPNLAFRSFLCDHQHFCHLYFLWVPYLRGRSKKVSGYLLKPVSVFRESLLLCLTLLILELSTSSVLKLKRTPFMFTSYRKNAELSKQHVIKD